MTRASATPVVIDALLAAAVAPIGDTATVSDGWAVTEEPGNFLMIGIDDPDADGFEIASESDQEWAAVGRGSRQQDGTVTCLALAWDGDGDLKAARDAVYGMCDVVATFLRTDPTLGVPRATLSVLIAAYGGHETLRQVQGDGGAVATVAFQVNFKARL